MNIKQINHLTKVIKGFVQRSSSRRSITLLTLPLLLLLIIQSSAWSQYSIYQTGLSNDWSYSDLMSCSVINGSNKTPLVYLNCTVTNNKKVVLRAQSNVFTLNKGSNIISRGDVDNKLTPIKTVFVDANFRALMDKTAMPSGGDYEVRLDLVEKTENAVLSYTQINRNVTPLSPFGLITPFDGSALDNTQPTFTWFRPMGTDGQTYNIRVVEIYNGQTANQAIRSNAAVLGQSDLNFNLYQTPSNGENIQSCKKYAWQVEVIERTEGQSRTTNISEVWTFSTSCSKSTSKYIETPYYGAKTKPELYSFPVYDTLRISLEHAYSNNQQIQASIVDMSNNQKEVSLQNERDNKSRTIIFMGDNRVAIPLLKKGLKKNAQYLLTIIDGSEKFFVPFLYLADE